MREKALHENAACTLRFVNVPNAHPIKPCDVFRSSCSTLKLRLTDTNGLLLVTASVFNSRLKVKHVRR